MTGKAVAAVGDPLTELAAKMAGEAEERRGFSGANAPPALSESRSIKERLDILLTRYKADREELARIDDRIAVILSAREDFAAEIDEQADIIAALRTHQGAVEGIYRKTKPAPKPAPKTRKRRTRAK